MVSGSNNAGAICTRRACPMADDLARLITLEDVRPLEESRFRLGLQGENGAVVVGLAWNG
jgi:hypothetical protein